MGALTGKVAFITGGAGGHGRATAKQFVEAGATVYATDLAVEAGQATAADCGATFLPHDVTDKDGWDEIVSRVREDTGCIDVLVNNAAIIEWLTMTQTTIEIWERVIAVNQTGPLLGMQAVAPAMIEQRSGSIINISSIGGLGGSSPCFAWITTRWPPASRCVASARPTTSPNSRCGSHPTKARTPAAPTSCWTVAPEPRCPWRGRMPRSPSSTAGPFAF